MELVKKKKKKSFKIDSHDKKHGALSSCRRLDILTALPVTF